VSRDLRESEYAALKQCPIFRGLPPDVFTDLLSIATCRKAPARTTIIEKGDRDGAVFVIVSGYLKVSSFDPDGKRATLNIMGPGELFGELSALDGSERSASVEAIEDVHLLVMERAAFIGLLHRHSAAAIQLAAFLGRRLRQLSAKMETRVFLDAGQRLAAQLVDLADRFGEQLPGGTTRIALHLSQRDFGELVDATRESVNRHMRALVTEGILDVEREQITILDMTALRGRATLPPPPPP